MRRDLQDVGTLQNDTSAQANINGNSEVIERTARATLSRFPLNADGTIATSDTTVDGDTGNQMHTDIDMNTYDLNNVGNINVTSINNLGADVLTDVAVLGQAVIDAQAAQAAAETAQTNAETAETNAETAETNAAASAATATAEAASAAASASAVINTIDTLPYQVADAVYLGSPFDVSGQVTAALDELSVEFSIDGLSFYVIGHTDRVVYQYTLTQAFDLRTATYASKSFSTTSRVTGDAKSLDFKPDGSKMYIADSSVDKCYTFDLSTPWDVSTASNTGQTADFSTLTGDSGLRNIQFNSDGTKVYAYMSNNDRVHEHDLITPYRIDAIYHVAPSPSLTTSATAHEQWFFNDDGTEFYIISSTGSYRVYKWELSTAWDITTAFYATEYFDLHTSASAPFTLSKTNGGNYFVYANQAREVYTAAMHRTLKWG